MRLKVIMDKIKALPTTSEEAKEYACFYTTRIKTIDEITREKQESEAALKTNMPDDIQDFHQKRLSSLNELLLDEDYLNGNYHQGIDPILFELIEWRAMFYAFQTVNIDPQPFDQHAFFQQWKVGGAYAMYSSLAKLLSRDRQDKSLRKLWWDIKDFVQNTEDLEEVKYISEQLDKNSDRFSNKGSKALLFRNKVVAHNEKSIDADLTHLDEDIRILIRVWSIITMWSAFPMMFPFRENGQAFSALESFYSPEDLRRLKSKRQEYLDLVKSWCKTNLITSQEEIRSPFGNLSVSISVVSK